MFRFKLIDDFVLLVFSIDTKKLTKTKKIAELVQPVSFSCVNEGTNR